ncbi:hypothetical protein [Nocardia pseudobrasiliensis]|uniref:Uncharacterized protein n=1 Tax=Nocardia pseudobrasiliensis TaxID=45979 RepID=A0A370IBA1_9NOCA|nr:hypothetical protein [Nocardia pseudobrasiliensis]RDI68002.1 hypothetical protein DFR76_102403 [Nocardia pseudobrasiliensis]
MTMRTKVVVYAVGESGATGESLGAATLLEPEFALVHPPLNQELASASRGLRVGVFSAEKDIGEVIDVARVRVVPDATDLVLLELAVGSNAPVRGVPVRLAEDPLGFEPFLQPSDADIVAAVREVFDEIPHDIPVGEPIGEFDPGGGFPVEDPIRWLARLFGGG